MITEQTENIIKAVRKWADKPTDEQLNKIADDTFEIGEEVCWVYKDDLEYAKRWCDENPKDWRKWAFYRGFVVPLPDTDSRKSLDGYNMLNDAMICVTDYPTEKCNPECDWAAVGEMICSDDLVWFGKAAGKGEK